MKNEVVFTRLDREIVELAEKCGSYLDAIISKFEEVGLDITEADEVLHPLIIKKLEEELYDLNLLKKGEDDTQRKTNLFMLAKGNNTS